MPMTTSKLVEHVRERLQQIDAELERLQAERAELKAAVSGEASKPNRRARTPVTKAAKGSGLSEASRKKMAAARQAAWAEVRKHGLKSLAELKAYKAKHAKAT